MSSSGSGGGANASDLDAALALLSGPDIVAHLRATSRSADYDAAARVLGDRDRRLAEAEAKAERAWTGLANLSAEVQVLQHRYLELKAKERRAPRRRTSRGAIAAAAPRGGRRAEEPAGLEGAIIDLCSSSSSSDGDDDELEEGEFRPDPVHVDVAGVSGERKDPVSSNADEGRHAAVSSQQKESPAHGDGAH